MPRFLASVLDCETGRIHNLEYVTNEDDMDDCFRWQNLSQAKLALSNMCNPANNERTSHILLSLYDVEEEYRNLNQFGIELPDVVFEYYEGIEDNQSGLISPPDDEDEYEDGDEWKRLIV